MLSGSGVGFLLASCVEESVRAGPSLSPTKATEDRMTAGQGRVDARKVLLGEAVIAPCLTAAWAPRGVGHASVVFVEESPRKAGSGCGDELSVSSLPIGGVPGLDAGLAVCAVVRRRCGVWGSRRSLAACGECRP